MQNGMGIPPCHRNLRDRSEQFYCIERSVWDGSSLDKSQMTVRLQYRRGDVVGSSQQSTHSIGICLGNRAVVGPPVEDKIRSVKSKVLGEAPCEDSLPLSACRVVLIFGGWGAHGS